MIVFDSLHKVIFSRKAKNQNLKYLYFVLVLLFFSMQIRAQITFQQARESLRTNRTRLLSQYAYDRNYANACQAWGNLTASQKGVFLTVTDLLGRREFMWGVAEPDILDYQYVGDEDDRAFGCAIQNEENPDCNNGCYVHPINYYGPACFFVTGQSCAEMNKCTSYRPAPRLEFDMALNHVQKIYEINGSHFNDGGGIDYNRIYFQADNLLLYQFRNLGYGYHFWINSTDLLGSHYPFTKSRQTDNGMPQGQTHFWAWDYNTTTLLRPGVVGVYDTNIVEIDLDYNTLHHSNPERYYNNVYGRQFYENHWRWYGLGGTAELDYSPTCKQ